MLHELRVGEPATLGETPFARYYGSVDATPLFLYLLGRYPDWSGNLDLFQELREPAEAALEWIDRYATSTATACGVHAPLRARPRDPGLEGLGDGIPDAPASRSPAGRTRGGAGLRGARQADMARLFELDGDGARAERLREEAGQVEAALERFWLDGDGCYAIGWTATTAGVGPDLEPGPFAVGGVVSDERASCIRDVLMGSDMFSGWGVRTLAESHPAYNPVGYHTGSVWPHDSALIAFGLRRYGFDEDFLLVFEGLLEAASRFNDYRLPSCSAASRARSSTSRCLPRRLPAAGVVGRLDPIPPQVGARHQPGRAPEAAQDHPPLAAALAGAGGRDGAPDRNARGGPALRAGR